MDSTLRPPASLQEWAAGMTDAQLQALAGAVGGFASGVFTCPFDVIKIRLQAQGSFVPIHTAARSRIQHKMYQGLVKTSRVIWRKEGVRGMYRGMGPLLLGYLPTWAIWFTAYQHCKQKMPQMYPQLSSSPNLLNLISSVAAGTASTIATNPIWTVKVRLMSQAYRPYRWHFLRRRRAFRPHWHYHSTLDAVHKMYMTEGIGAFYSGLRASFLGLSHVAVQFPAYEYLKRKFTGHGMGVPGGSSPVDLLGIISASVLSKVVASSASYPHEVVRTRLQTQRRPVPGAEFLQGLGGFTGLKGVGGETMLLQPKYRGVIHTFRVIVREEGWRALYTGMGVNMTRSVPAATVTLFTYEYVISSLQRLKGSGEAAALDGPRMSPHGHCFCSKREAKVKSPSAGSVSQSRVGGPFEDERWFANTLSTQSFLLTSS